LADYIGKLSAFDEKSMICGSDEVPNEMYHQIEEKQIIEDGSGRKRRLKKYEGEEDERRTTTKKTQIDGVAEQSEEDD
jgi:D-lyxose ketol-isomerase